MEVNVSNVSFSYDDNKLFSDFSCCFSSGISAIVGANGSGKSTLLDLIDGYEVVLDVNYNEQKELEYLIKDNYQKEYSTNVTYIIKCDESIKNILESKYNIVNIKKIKIER